MKLFKYSALITLLSVASLHSMNFGEKKHITPYYIGGVLIFPAYHSYFQSYLDTRKSFFLEKKKKQFDAHNKKEVKRLTAEMKKMTAEEVNLFMIQCALITMNANWQIAMMNLQNAVGSPSESFRKEQSII